MRIISLFDGISCGRVALERAGIKVDEYISYEIDKDAIKISLSNYPDIIQKGSVIGEDFTKYNGYDLLIGGSPCQGFSYAGKRLNFNDERSKLFFEYVRALKEINPKYFLFENVDMKKEWQDVISSFLGVKPIKINASLVSAQNRVRLYWTNIPNIKQPKDKNIELLDIIENKENGLINKATILGRRINSDGHRDDYNKDIPITQCLEVRDTNRNKSNCLTTVDKDNVLTSMPIGRHIDVYKRKLPFRYYTIKEYCRLQTLPDNYCDAISVYKAKKCVGNAWCVDVIVHILKNIV